MTTPALTRAATGSTICPGCNKRFASTPGTAVTDTVATVENMGRVDSIGQRHRGIGTHEVTRRWHTGCLDDFEARNAAYRERVRQDQRDMIASLCEAAGIDPATKLAEFDARADR